MAFTYIFKRVEKKYMLTKEQYESLIEAITPYMEIDKYGETEIRNIYFDNADDELIETSLKKPTYKEKLRLRSYGTPENDSTVFFEIKKKYRGIVYKRRISMTLSEAYEYIESGKLPSHLEGNIPVEIDYMMHRYCLSPKAFISYRRVAWAGKDNPDLRITFDRDITSRYDDRWRSRSPAQCPYGWLTRSAREASSPTASPNSAPRTFSKSSRWRQASDTVEQYKMSLWVVQTHTTLRQPISTDH